jgi:DNA-binding response OmpR family regulator
MIQILIVEDDIQLRTLMMKYLEKAGYETLGAKDGKEGLTLFRTHSVDLIITDIMMPHVDGLQMVKAIRHEDDKTPVMMLTALGSFKDKEAGFNNGVDDYIVKSIDMNELVLRVKALLRRVNKTNDQTFKHKSVTLNIDGFECRVANTPIELAKKEFQLYYKLVTNPGRIFTREQLMDDIWGYDSYSYQRTVDTHIKRIREKVITDDIELVTVRGLGYKAVLK